MTSLPWISIPTVALFFAEVRGYSKLYDNVDDNQLGKSASVDTATGCQATCSLIVDSLPFSGWAGIVISMIAFLFFTDMCIYWIHRFLHHKLIYKVS